RHIVSGLTGREYAGYRIGVPAFHIGCALGDGRIPQEELAALDRVADAVRAGREDRDDERRGEPGQLLPILLLEQEVVDRHQEDDVEQQEEADKGEAGRFRGLDT